MTTDVDLFVIGGGSGGVRAARVAADHGARVAIAEEFRYGGTCVIRGCIPKKLFVYAAEFSHAFEDAAAYGWSLGRPTFDWATLVANKDGEIARLSGIYRELLAKRKVTTFDARARIVDRNTVEVGGDRVRAATILIATGGRPRMPSDVPGIEHAVSSDQMFHLEALPERFAVLGGGYIAVELAGILAGLGCKVSLVHRRDRVLRGFDQDVREQVTAGLGRLGVEVHDNETVVRIERSGRGSELEVTLAGGARLDAGGVLVAVGRVPATDNLGLGEVGVALGEHGQVVVDHFSRSSVPNIYAVGDCTDRVNLTPVAIREGQAFADSVFGGMSTPVDHTWVPSAVFASPPVAAVGLSEEGARERGHEITVYVSKFRPLAHTLPGRDQPVFMKLVTERASGRVLGLHMVGKDAPEIVQSAAIAMRMGATKADFDGTCALHPTTAEELVLMRTPRD